MPRVKEAKSHARLTPFLRGVAYGLHLAGQSYREIADQLLKPDASETTQQAVAGIIKQVQSHGGVLWDGGATAASSAGRQRNTSRAEDK